MNHIYRTVWSERLGCHIAVAETTRSQGKASGVSGALLAGVLLGSVLATAQPAWAAPSGGNVAAGSGSITQAGNATTIQQSSNKLLINWSSFNIGAGESVSFNQPSASAIALNRVTSVGASQIDGALNANGQVWVLNPDGLLFGRSAQVNVGGLVASTLKLSDNQFLAGHYQFSADGSQGVVRNQGSLAGGYVALLGQQVSNSGSIRTPGGMAALGAGDTITLNFDGQRLLGLQVDAGAYQALVDNQGLIQADDGSVRLSAVAKDALLQTVVNNSGVIEARGMQARGGKIELIGGFNGGTVQVGGTLDASSASHDGGFVETSGAHVKVAEGAKVSTLAPVGKSGTWLIDPDDFTVSAGGAAQTDSGIGADTLSANLAGGSIALQTNAAGSSGNGDLFVNAPVSWNAATQLTLNAYRNIVIGADITAQHANGQVALLYGQGAAPFGNTASYSLTNGARINLQAGPNFITQLGVPGVLQTWTVLTSLGSAGSTTGTDLQGMLGNLAGHYVLGADINASATSGWNSGAGFAPVGTGSTPFTGQIDGLGHTISGLTINRPSTDNVGLVGVASGATVRNVGIANGSVIGQDNVGGLVGSNDFGAVADSWASAAVSGRDQVGGLIGTNFVQYTGYATTVDRSYATGSVSGRDMVGGLVGFSLAMDGSSTSVTNSHATGNVSGRTSVGGLMGFMQASSLYGQHNYTTNTVSSSYASGAVLASNQGAGGLIGTSQAYQGGIAEVSDSYATGSVSAPGQAGGLLGFSTRQSNGDDVVYYPERAVVPGQSRLIRVYATGLVTSTGTAGGLVGENASGGQVLNSHWDSGSTGQAQAVGLNSGSMVNVTDIATEPSLVPPAFIHNAYSHLGTWTQQGTSSVWIATDTNNTPQWVMIEGQTRPFLYSEYNTTIHNAHQLQLMAMDLGAHYTLANNVDASETSGSNLSGMWSSSGFAPLGVSGTPFTGTLDGAQHTISGLTINRPDTYSVGLFDAVAGGATVSNLGLVDASITGGTFVGGLVGWNEGTISNSYATGAVFGNSVAGGLVGVNHSVVNNSYATGAVFGSSVAGGLVGENDDTVRNSYATGTVSGAFAGGLVGTGFGAGSAISNSYATGAVTGSLGAGGLVASSEGTVTSSYWNTETSGQNTSAGGQGAVGLSSYDMQRAASYTGWDIATQGGSNSVWRIYEGQTTPLLRSFLTPLTVTQSGAIASRDYNGSRVVDGATISYVGTPDANLLLGTGTVLAASKDVGTQATLVSGLYSTQQGYDINQAPGTVTINRLASVTWTGGASGDWFTASNWAGGALPDKANVAEALIPSGSTVNFSGASQDAVHLDRLAGTLVGPGSLALSAGTLHVDTGGITLANLTQSGGAINSLGAVTLAGSFRLQGGDWVQNSSTLPAFSAADFQISGGSFLRAQGGDGSAGAPWQLVDVYGLQGMATHLAEHHALAGDIAASGTAAWNGGAGFMPVGNAYTPFTGSLDGAGHAISGLTINRPNDGHIGLFGDTQGASFSHLALQDVVVAGRDQVGALVGLDHAAIQVDGVQVSGSVSGHIEVGGLLGYGWGAGQVSHSQASATVGGHDYVGGLVGHTNGTIDHASASGNVTASGDFAGGLVGWGLAVSDSTASGTVSGNSYVGGLAGQVHETVARSSASGNVSGVNRVGGAVGWAQGTVSNVSARGTVTASGDYVGGLAGVSEASITGSSASGNVVGRSVVGGLSGEGIGARDSWSSGAVSGVRYVGGLVGVGMFDPSQLINSHYDISAVRVTVDGVDQSAQVTPGGLFGPQYADWVTGGRAALAPAGYFQADAQGSWQLGNATDLKNLLAFTSDPALSFRLTRDIDLATAPGWCLPRFAGALDGGYHVISGLQNQQAWNDLQGLVGVLSGSVRRLGVSGTVRGAGGVGGLVGFLADQGSVDESYASVDVGGSFVVGGLAGQANGHISNSYADGTVRGLPWGDLPPGAVGGLVGSNFGTIDKSYGAATVVCAADCMATGGMVAVTPPGQGSRGTATGSYAITSRTGTTNWAGAADYPSGEVALDDASARQVSTYANAGWDIASTGGSTATWRIYEGQTLPLLRGFLTPLTVSAGGAHKEYDGAAFTSADLSAITYSQTPNANLLGTASQRVVNSAPDAGTYATAVDGLYANQQGYDLSLVGGSAVIQPKPVTVGGAGGSPTYDGVSSYATLANLAGYTTSAALVGHDAFDSVSLTTNQANPNGVAQAGSFTATPSDVRLGTGNPNNYSFSYAPGTITVAKADLAVAAVASLTGNVYNGNAYTGSYTMTNALGNDASAISVSGQASGTNAGTYRSNLALSGAVLANYNTTISNADLVVSAKPVTVTSADGHTTYDARTSYATLANGTGFSNTALVGNDAIGSVTQTASQSGVAQAGSFSVTPSAAQLSTGNAANYAFSYAPGTTTVDKANLAVAAVASLTGNVYNGNAYTGGYTMNALGNDASAISVSGQASGTNAGTYRSNLALSGTVLANYNTTVSNADLVVSAKPVTVTSADGHTTYDASTSYATLANGTGFSNTALVGNDAIGSVTQTANQNGVAQAGSVSVTPSAAQLSSGNAGNYAFTYLPGTITVGQADLTVTALGATALQSSVGYAGGNGVSYSGFVGGQGASVLGGSLLYGGSSQGATLPGSYTITASGLQSGNYAIRYVDGVLTVLPVQTTATMSAGLADALTAAAHSAPPPSSLPSPLTLSGLLTVEAVIPLPDN